MNLKVFRTGKRIAQLKEREIEVCATSSSRKI